MNQMKIALTLAALFLASCASPDWRASYRGCSGSGEAYFRGIPLASRSEHARAELFTPIEASNCLIYVVRSDRSGSKSAPAKLFLYDPKTEPPVLPPDYWPWFGSNALTHPVWSERHWQETSRELRRAEIFSLDVYAAWELAPGSYVLDASLDIFQPFARAVVACAAGRTHFWAVAGTAWFSSKAKLYELDETEGKALVRHRLRSAGIQPGGRLSKGWVGDRVCPAQ